MIEPQGTHVIIGWISFNIEKMGNDMFRAFGQVARLAFILVKLTVHEKF